MRNSRVRLSVEGLERRDNPSGWTDFWDGVGYYGDAFVDGLGEGATNIVTGAHDAVVEVVDVGGDLVTIYTTDVNELDPDELNSRLFQGAAATAGNPEAAEQFDQQLVYGIVTLGVGPLVESGYDAIVTGDSTQFSQQAGGFGVMVLVPYAGVKGMNGLPRIPIRVPVAQPSMYMAGADGTCVVVSGSVVWQEVAVLSFAVPVETSTGITVFAMAMTGPGGEGIPSPRPAEPTEVTDSTREPGETVHDEQPLTDYHEPVSTGRTTPNNLNEWLAMEEVISNPQGKQLPIKMSDVKNNLFAEDGWIKMAQNVNGVEIHYVKNINTGQVMDFKFKN